MSDKYDLIIIGAGPGGYVAAIKAAKLGLKTAIIENREVGGTCLNRGCIPAKAMLHASGLYREMRESERFGIFADQITYDYGKILQYKEETTEQLVQGIELLLRGNGIYPTKGTGTLLTDKKVRVTTEDGEQILEAEHIMLATGSKPILLNIPGIELPGVITSDELFQLKEVPKSLVIIGGGVIGVEFATVYSALGTDVTILEAMPRILPNMDKEISQSLKMILKRRGVNVVTDAKVQSITESGEAYICSYMEGENKQEAVGQYVLCAVGRCPNTEELFTPEAQPETDKGRVLVDEHFQTSIEGVYAIGDLIFGTQLAHAASAQGVYVVESIAGNKPSIDPSVVPGCVYTDPEIASVGLTEEQAREMGISVKVGKFITNANGKAVITKDEKGFVKIVADQKTDVILGAQMLCGRATDMIGEFTTAIVNQMTVKQLLKGMRAHPTYNESVGEALEELEGGAIHVMPKRKR